MPIYCQTDFIRGFSKKKKKKKKKKKFIRGIGLRLEVSIPKLDNKISMNH